MKVGFIGLGVMGAPMAANILKGGHELTVYDRSAEAVARLVQAGAMPAYVINDMVVTDPELFERYKQLSPPTVAQYGGRFLARGGQIENLEGDWSPRRVVIIEFPSLERARAWCDSPEYAPPKILRQKASTSTLIVVEGVAPA